MDDPYELQFLAAGDMPGVLGVSDARGRPLGSLLLVDGDFGLRWHFSPMKGALIVIEQLGHISEMLEALAADDVRAERI